MTKKEADELKRIMRERDADNGGIPLNAVDRGYHLACEHLYKEIDKLTTIEQEVPVSVKNITRPKEGIEESLSDLAASLEKEHSHIVDEKGVEYSAGMIRSIVEVLKAVRTARRVPDGC